MTVLMRSIEDSADDQGISLRKLLIMGGCQETLVTLSARVRQAIPRCRVFTALSVEEGVQAAWRELPDLILLDFPMPGMSGEKVCRGLRENSRGRHIPVIVLLAEDAELSLGEKCLEAGADGLMVKPVIPWQLMAQIRVLQRAVKAEEELRAEMKSFEEALQARTLAVAAMQRRYQALFNSMTDAIYIVNCSGAILEANRTACGRMGYDHTELLRMTIADLVPPGARSTVNEQLKVSREKGSALFETGALTREGHEIPVEVHARQIDLEGKEVTLYVSRDLSERRRIEMALRNEEEKYRNLVDLAQEGIWAIDAQGITSFVNPGMARMLGYSPGEMTGRHLFEFMDEKAVGLCREKLSAREKGVRETHEFEFLHAHGGSICTSLSTAPLYDEKGLYCGAVAAVTDITERRERDREILAAREKAEEASRLKSVILANLSHEFRTPLNGILGVADILKSEVDTEEQREMVELIASSGRRLYKTLDVFMKMAQLAAGELQLALKPLCCSHIVVKTVRDFREAARKKNLSLEVEVLGDTEIMADEKALQDIFHNLLDNALKFTNQGKVRVTVEERERRGRPEIAVSVSDTGIGIPPERRGLLFQEFRQLSEGIRRDYEGCGLGLTVAKKTAGLLGGTLTYESGPGAGSVFTVSFPSIIVEETGLPSGGTHLPPAPCEKESPFPVASPARVPRVLVVEDNYINVLVVINSLENICLVDHADDGPMALQKAREHHYDAFLIDINLGSEMDGVELQQELRKMKEYHAVPVVAVTGYALSGDQELFLSRGFSHYLPKPFEGKDIISLMNGIFQ